MVTVPRTTTNASADTGSTTNLELATVTTLIDAPWLSFRVLLQSCARVEKPNLKTLVVLAPGCLSCLEYPADDHRVWVRVPVGKHRALAFP